MLYTDPVPRDPLPPDGRSTYTTVYRRPAHETDVDVEAFHWGGLTAGKWTTALWIFLAPFAFANISGWTVRRQHRLGRLGIRAAGLGLSALFVAQLGVVIIDMPYHWLQPRLEATALRWAVVGLFLLFAFLYFLLVVKASAQSHFEKLRSGGQLSLVFNPDPKAMVPKEAGADPEQWDDPAGATLDDPVVWQRHAIVHRLRRLHLGAGMLVVSLMAARAIGNALMEWVILAVFGLIVIVLITTTFTPKARWGVWATAGVPLLTLFLLAVTLVVLWSGPFPASPHWTKTYETSFHIAIFMFAGAALIPLSSIASLGAFAIGAQLGGAYGIAAAVVFENAIGVDEVSGQGAGWTAVAMLLLTLLLVGVAAGLARPWNGQGLEAAADEVPRRTRKRRIMTLLRRLTVDSRWVFRVAALFGVTAGVVAVLGGCRVESGCSPFNLGKPDQPLVAIILVAVALALIWWSAHRVWGVPAVLIPLAAAVLIWILDRRTVTLRVFGIDAELETLVGISIAVTILLPATFILNSLLKGFRDAERRRKVGILWDVASFFPRWYHPLAPPGYGPYIVNKLREELETKHRDVLSAHSQGAMVALVTLGQMSEGLPRTLLTYGCQLGLHYPTHFPTAGIPELVKEVAAKLDSGNWVNLWRDDDPLGGQVGGPVVDMKVREGVGHSGYEVTPTFARERRGLLERLTSPRAVESPQFSETP